MLLYVRGCERLGGDTTDHTEHRPWPPRAGSPASSRSRSSSTSSTRWSGRRSS